MRLVNLFTAIPHAIREQLLVWKFSKKNTETISRFYIYSIVLDPFLFFVIFDRLTFGFSLTLSRLFQVFFYLLLIVNLVGLKRNSDVVILNKYWRLFLIFIIYCLIHCQGFSPSDCLSVEYQSQLGVLEFDLR